MAVVRRTILEFNLLPRKMAAKRSMEVCRPARRRASASTQMQKALIRRAVLLHAIQRLREADQRISIGGQIALFRGRLDLELGALAHLVDELTFLGRVLHPE